MIGLGVNVHLAQQLAPMMQQVAAICDAVKQSGAISTQAEYQRCAEQTLKKLSAGQDPQSIANELAAGPGKKILIAAAVGSVVLIGGAIWWSRRR